MQTIISAEIPGCHLSCYLIILGHAQTKGQATLFHQDGRPGLCNHFALEALGSGQAHCQYSAAVS